MLVFRLGGCFVGERLWDLRGGLGLYVPSPFISPAPPSDRARASEKPFSEILKAIACPPSAVALHGQNRALLEQGDDRSIEREADKTAGTGRQGSDAQASHRPPRRRSEGRSAARRPGQTAGRACLPPGRSQGVQLNGEQELMRVFIGLLLRQRADLPPVLLGTGDAPVAVRFTPQRLAPPGRPGPLGLRPRLARPTACAWKAETQGHDRHCCSGNAGRDSTCAAFPVKRFSCVHIVSSVPRPVSRIQARTGSPGASDPGRAGFQSPARTRRSVFETSDQFGR